MRNLRKLTRVLILIPGFIAPSTVSCRNELVDFADDVENLNLGYLNDLESETILEAFAKKNPKVKMEYVTHKVTGNTQMGIIRTIVPNFHYKTTMIKVNYYSKLIFNDEDEIFGEIKSKSEKYILDKISIRDEYNEEIDEKIGYPFSKILNFNYEIDRKNKIYKVIISLKDVSESFQSTESIPLWWSEDTRIIVTTLKLRISL